MPGYPWGRAAAALCIIRSRRRARPTAALNCRRAALPKQAGDVRINELLLKNTYSAIDEDGERSAWVELYNGSSSAVDLSNYALSDNGNRLLKWSLPSRQLEAGAYTLVFLSGKDRKDDGELHTSFKLGTGETKLYLTQLSTGTYETVNVPTENSSNVSYGLAADGTWQFYPEPTPQIAQQHTGLCGAVGGFGDIFVRSDDQ